MKVFLDTSSLVKLYHQEIGTAALLEFLSYDVDEIWLSELTTIEFRSAFWKKARIGELRNEDAIRAIDCFDDDQNKFRWVKLTPSIIKMALFLIMRHGGNGLRTLDSIQLACAVFLKAQDMICITSDSLLNTFFLEENLAIPTFLPESAI